MSPILTTKRVLLVVGTALINPAAAADMPVQLTNAPSAVSIVPQSGFFLGLGASANSVDFDSQNVYARGTSNTPADYNLVGVLQPPIIGTAAGGTGFTLDTKTALAPSIQ